MTDCTVCIDVNCKVKEDCGTFCRTIPHNARAVTYLPPSTSEHQDCTKFIGRKISILRQLEPEEAVARARRVIGTQESEGNDSNWPKPHPLKLMDDLNAAHTRIAELERFIWVGHCQTCDFAIRDLECPSRCELVKASVCLKGGVKC